MQSFLRRGPLTLFLHLADLLNKPAQSLPYQAKYHSGSVTGQIFHIWSECGENTFWIFHIYDENVVKPQGSAQLRHSHFLLWQMLLTISPIPPPPQTCFLIPLLQDGQEGWVSTEVKGEMKSWKACSESAACGWDVLPKLWRHPAAPTSTREPQPTSCHVMLAPHPPWAPPTLQGLLGFFLVSPSAGPIFWGTSVDPIFSFLLWKCPARGGWATRQWRTGFGEPWTGNNRKERQLKTLLHTLDCMPMILDIWNTLDKTSQECETALTSQY